MGFFALLRQCFSLALEPVLELALVAQTDLKLRDLPASASQVLGLKACATTARVKMEFFCVALTVLEHAL